MKDLTEQELKSLKKLIKKYANPFLALSHIDQSLASEFKKKQEAFGSSSSCCSSENHSTILKSTHSDRQNEQHREEFC